MSALRKWFFWSLALLLITDNALAQDKELIAPVSEWRWLHPTDGVDPGKENKEFHKTWFKPDFDDAKWKQDKDAVGMHGGFGYGEEDFTGVDIGLPDADDPVDTTKPIRRRTAYFRHAFETEKECPALLLKLQRDDGIIVYLDGKEVLRDGMGKQDDAYELMAAETTSGEDETRLREYKLKGPLRPGKHLLAISLHNRPGGSTDLRIAEISLSEAKAEEDAPSEAEAKKDDAKKPEEKKPEETKNATDAQQPEGTEKPSEKVEK